MKKPLLFLALSVLLVSCVKLTDPVIIDVDIVPSFLSGPGVFIVNEGNFNWGNGSLSFYSYDSAKLYNNVFRSVNNRILGDIPNQMVIQGDYAYIVVNNSGKIEVVKQKTLGSIKTIEKLKSPRYISMIGSTKSYVSSLFSDSLTIIDLSTNATSGYIDIGHPSEALVTFSGKAFAAHWYNGNKIMVINTINDILTDSIEVGPEPESMVIDKNAVLWVLCNGGWKRENFAELIAINTLTLEIEKRFTFPSKDDSPLCLQIDGTGNTLYYIHNGIKRMSIDAAQLPEVPLIAETERKFYKFGVNPLNGDIFITDAADYQQKGYVLYYKNDGTFVTAMQADIIPGSLCFKLPPESVIE